MSSLEHYYLGVIAGFMLGCAVRDSWPTFLQFKWCEMCKTWVYHAQWEKHTVHHSQEQKS